MDAKNDAILIFSPRTIEKSPCRGAFPLSGLPDSLSSADRLVVTGSLVAELRPNFSFPLLTAFAERRQVIARVRPLGWGFTSLSWFSWFEELSVWKGNQPHTAPQFYWRDPYCPRNQNE